MTSIRKFLLSIVLLWGFLLAGCSGSKTPKMANEIQFSSKGISSITISYDDENINFYESDDERLIIKEYMTKKKRSYYAKVNQKDSSVHISEGSKPFLKQGFSRNIEVYLPVSYRENLKVSTTDGDIDFTGMNLDLAMFRVDCTSGTVVLDDVVASEVHLSSTDGTLKIGSVRADQIKMETTHGVIRCEKLVGNVIYTSTSGSVEVKSASGSGSYITSNSGKLDVVYPQVNGDLLFYNKNDNIALTLPENLEFEFEGTTKNGSVSTNFEQDMLVTGHITNGIVGANPNVTVKVETKNGNIEVRQ